MAVLQQTTGRLGSRFSVRKTRPPPTKRRKPKCHEEMEQDRKEKDPAQAEVRAPAEVRERKTQTAARRKARDAQAEEVKVRGAETAKVGAAGRLEPPTSRDLAQRKSAGPDMTLGPLADSISQGRAKGAASNISQKGGTRCLEETEQDQWGKAP